MAGSNFEMQLGQLADSQISQDAPMLASYKVGFQLIDKDDDETRGVGVAVFKINDQWIYIPVFYLNGRVKGTDLMFLPDSGQFMPTNEAWIIYLKGRQPLNIGEPDAEDAERGGAPGDIDILEDVDLHKGAALLSPAAWRAMRTPAAFKQDVTDLRTWIPLLGKQAAADFTAMLQANPAFANAILRFYSPADLAGIAKRAAEQAKPAAADGATELRILTADSTDTAGLADDEKEALKRDGVFVVDNRKETSTVFKGEVDHTKLSTPTTDGLHDVLMADGTFSRFYVFRDIETERHDGASMRSIGRRLMLVPLDDRGGHMQAPALIQATRLQPGQDKEHELMMTLGVAASKGAMDPALGSNLLLVDPHGNYRTVDITTPREAEGDSISLRQSCAGSPWLGHEGGYTGKGPACMVFTHKPGSLFAGGSTLYVPDKTRMIPPLDYKARSKYHFGSPATVADTLVNKAGLKPLKVYSDGISITLSSGQAVGKPLSKVAALVELVKIYGIAAPTAKKMVKEAAAAGRPNSMRYLVKRASLPFMDTGESMAAPANAPDTETDKGMPAEPLSDVDTAIKASDNGVKEVMDVSVLRTLAMKSKAVDTVEGYMPDLMRGLDRVGRLLFLFYWHNDDFQDRYGTDELIELEESLRTVFQALSDLMLFLNRKTVSPDSSVEAVAGDLSEDLGS